MLGKPTDVLALLGQHAFPSLEAGQGCSPCVVSLVGGGGTTTLLFAFAARLRSRGLRVITTTTTKIYAPTKEQSPCLLLSPQTEDLRAALRRWGHVTVGQGLLPENKVRGVEPYTVDAWCGAQMAHVMVVEADGAAHKGLKVLAEHEPPVPHSTTVHVALWHAGSLGRLACEVVHRVERAEALCGLKPGYRVEPEHVVHLLLHKDGILRACPPAAHSVILAVGQAEQMEAARRVFTKAHKMHPEHRAVWYFGSPAINSIYTL